MSLRNVVGRWTERPAKLPGVWFGQDLRMDKNCGRVWWSVSLKVWAEWQMRKLLPSSYYRMTAVP